jgi:hypothetical protein
VEEEEEEEEEEEVAPRGFVLPSPFESESIRGRMGKGRGTCQLNNNKLFFNHHSRC